MTRLAGLVAAAAVVALVPLLLAGFVVLSVAAAFAPRSPDADRLPGDRS